ncbi:hypothetical protein, partial [Pontibacter korlensis]
MEEIRVLATLNSHANFSSTRSLFELSKGKESKLYQNALNNIYTDDYIASKALYGSNPNDVRYKMLKVRLKKRLYNNLFFVDYDRLKIGKVYQAELECLKLLHHAHTLSRLYELDLVLSNTSKVRKIALKYEFTNFLIDALELELECHTESGNFKEFQKCTNELTKLLKKKLYEREAVSLYQTIKLDGKRSVKLRRKHMANFSSSIARLYDIYCLTDSFEAFYSYYKANIIYSEMIGDFDAIVDLTLDSEQKISAGKINITRFNRTFNKFELVYAHLRAKKLEQGLRYASEFLPDFKENSPNWFAYLENYFLLALHSANYELALNLLHRVSNSVSINRLSASAKERWNLYEAYYLLMAGDTSGSLSKKNPFLLSLPEYSKDKQGFNVAILILQFIFYLHKKDTEALLYRIESLKKYILT